jgi:hypothetical protein
MRKANVSIDELKTIQTKIVSMLEKDFEKEEYLDEKIRDTSCAIEELIEVMQCMDKEKTLELIK